MESLIGSPLLTRTTKGSVLTQHGDLVVQWARAVMDAAEQLDACLAALKPARLAHISIAASLTLAELLLPSWLVAVPSRQVNGGSPTTASPLPAPNRARRAGSARG